jgi:CDP-diglyceride synthetase
MARVSYIISKCVIKSPFGSADHYYQHVVFADAQLLPFITNHRMISFTLYVIGFMGFVMSLKKGFLKQQFGLFCWVHMTLLMIVVSRCGRYLCPLQFPHCYFQSLRRQQHP